MLRPFVSGDIARDLVAQLVREIGCVERQVLESHIGRASRLVLIVVVAKGEVRPIDHCYADVSSVVGPSD